LREAQQSVAGAFDVQVLAGIFLEIGVVKVTVQVSVAGDFLDGAQASVILSEPPPLIRQELLWQVPVWVQP
jgi:hypothetical protein